VEERILNKLDAGSTEPVDKETVTEVHLLRSVNTFNSHPFLF